MLRVICKFTCKTLCLISLLYFAFYGLSCLGFPAFPDIHLCKNNAKGKYAQWYLNFSGEQ
jgi:hypothetical protein